MSTKRTANTVLWLLLTITLIITAQQALSQIRGIKIKAAADKRAMTAKLNMRPFVSALLTSASEPVDRRKFQDTVFDLKNSFTLNSQNLPAGDISLFKTVEFRIDEVEWFWSTTIIHGSIGPTNDFYFRKRLSPPERERAIMASPWPRSFNTSTALAIAKSNLAADSKKLLSSLSTPPHP